MSPEPLSSPGHIGIPGVNWMAISRRPEQIWDRHAKIFALRAVPAKAFGWYIVEQLFL